MLNDKRAQGRKKIMAVQAGDLLKIKIENVAFGGAGVGRAEGMAVFVPFTAPDEEVKVEITEVRKRFAIGRAKEILSPSADRISPLCRYFGRCGGCQMQHMTYERQLKIKEGHVREVFVRLGKFPSPPVLGIIPSPRSFHYRNKAEYHIGVGKNGMPEIGFMRDSEISLVDVERCEIVEESLNRSYGAFREAVLSGRMIPRGVRQTIWSASEGEVPLNIWDDFQETPFIVRRVKDMSLTVPYEGFFQANSFLLDGLVDKVLEYCALEGIETVVDAYCGVGLFSLFLSHHASSITGMEIDGNAVRCAENNLKQAGIPQTVFYEGDVAFLLQERFVKKRMRADVIVLDPPRTGCSRAVLDAVRKAGMNKLVYVSCNPSTQARDIRYLVDRGFALRCLQPLDMFPQTAHIEVIAFLEREKS
jgi:23S rRNA (uracil1939-C5)-methyltransferase